MATCDELESQILDRVAGTLPEAKAGELEAHLEGCPHCRSWKASCEEAVRLCALPASPEAELRAFAHLPSRARAAFRERTRESHRGRWLAVTAGVAALAALLLVVTPGWRARLHPESEGQALVTEGEGEGTGAEELVTWALSDPLEDELAFADEGDAAEANDEVIDPGRGLDLDLEQTE